MNSVVKEKWLAALRSGEYEQSSHKLRDVATNSFCCLGVLCDLHAKETGDEWNNSTGSYHGENEILPEHVKSWANLSDYSGEFFINSDKYDALTLMNDRGSSFSEIASVIEEYF